MSGVVWAAVHSGLINTSQCLGPEHHLAAPYSARAQNCCELRQEQGALNAQ